MITRAKTESIKDHLCYTFSQQEDEFSVHE